MAVNDVERDKAIMLANYIHCSVHEWPTEDDVPLLCYALLHEVDQSGELRAELAAVSQQSDRLREALEEMRLRALFVGHPGEAFHDRGDGVMVPDWRDALEKCEEALNPNSTPKPTPAHPSADSTPAHPPISEPSE